MPDNKVDGHNKAEIGNTKTKYQENDKTIHNRRRSREQFITQKSKFLIRTACRPLCKYRLYGKKLLQNKN